MKANDMVGKKYGRLTVIGRAANSKDGKARWICRCDCGRIKRNPTYGYDLKSGKVKSCGCIYEESNKERNRTHGMTGTRLYTIWQSMKQRCSRDPNYKHVSVCAEWNNFHKFMEWAISSGYSESLTLDRIDNREGYNPENCRWATYQQQENNRTNNRIVKYREFKMTASELARFLNIPYATLLYRINNGWPESDLSMPIDLGNAKKRKEKKSA